MKAIDIAERMYADAGQDFAAVLGQHLNTGIVISSPLWFLMLRAVQLPDRRQAWFVECAVGNMRDLANLIALRLPFISFCRVKNGKKQTKTYRTDRLLQLAQREIKIKA